ncbi:MAG: SseB family protein [Microbacteriaceae bacterium]|nr:SseB family protein [Microbacteriaceae bacterium]
MSADQPGGETDSAGIPWEGRAFHDNPDADDNGTAPARVIEAIRRFRASEVGTREVLEALRVERLLLPLLAVRGDEGTGPHGQLVDKTQELSIVTTAAPDGRATLVAFTSVDAMRAWDPSARPIPIQVPRIALAAAAEGTPLIVVDPVPIRPGEDTIFAIRRPAFRALATGERWTPSYEDPEVLDAFLASSGREPVLVAVQLAPGDPQARLAGAELLVQLTVRDGLPEEELRSLIARLGERWAADAVIAERVDSISVVVERL